MPIIENDNFLFDPQTFLIRCQHCRLRQSLKTRTFLSKMKISLNYFEILLFGLLKNLSAENIFDICQSYVISKGDRHGYSFYTNAHFTILILVSIQSIYNCLQKIRKTISNFMEAYIIMHPLPRDIIEADEAIITARRRGLIGRYPNGQIWLFGLYHRDLGYGYIFAVPN
jgi:hypothetical protein